MAIVDDQARIIARARVTDDAAGLGGLLDLLAEHGHGELARIEIAIETDKGLFVAALVAAGFMRFPDQSTRGGSVPRAARAGWGKSDRGDTVMLGQHLAHRPARSPAAAGRHRASPRGQDNRPATSGSDLGTPAGSEPAALATA